MAACGGGPTSPPGSFLPSAVAASVVEAPSLVPEATPEGAQIPIRAGFTAMELVPGRYAMPRWFLVPMSLELGEGWRGIRDDKARQVNLLRGLNDVGHGTLWLAPYAITNEVVDAFVTELRATPLLTFEKGVPVEIAGVRGRQFDGQAQTNPDEAGSGSRVPGTVDIPAMRRLHNSGLTDFTWYTESVEARLRFVFVEVGASTLVVYIEAPPDEFDAFIELADTVLASIRFYPRS
jgi:hypothetical protein